MNKNQLDQKIKAYQEKIKSLEKKLNKAKKSKPDIIDLVSDDDLSKNNPQAQKKQYKMNKSKKQTKHSIIEKKQEKTKSDPRQYIDVKYQQKKLAKKLKARWDGTAWYIPNYISNEDKKKLRKKYNPKKVKTTTKQETKSTTTSEKKDKIIKNMREHRRFNNMLMLEKKNTQRI